MKKKKDTCKRKLKVYKGYNNLSKYKRSQQKERTKKTSKLKPMLTDRLRCKTPFRSNICTRKFHELRTRDDKKSFPPWRYAWNISIK